MAAAGRMAAIRRRGRRTVADSRRRRGAWRNRLRVWIGYPWAHAQVLPWQITLGGGDHQWEAYARALMRARRRRTAAPAVGSGPPRPSSAGVRHRCRPARRAGTHGLGRRLAALVLPRSAVFLSGAVSRRCDSGGLVLAETGALSCLWRSAQGWEDLITLRRDPGQSLETLLSAAELLRPRGRERLSLVVPVRAGCAALAGRLALAGRAASHAGGGGMKARIRGMADFARRAGSMAPAWSPACCCWSWLA